MPHYFFQNVGLKMMRYKREIQRVKEVEGRRKKREGGKRKDGDRKTAGKRERERE